MTPRGEPREHKFTMVMTNDERTMLDALAAADHRSAADWLRMAIRSAHEARFPAPSKPKTKPKK